MRFKEMPSSQVIMKLCHFDSVLLLFYSYYFTYAEIGRLNSGDLKL